MEKAERRACHVTDQGYLGVWKDTLILCGVCTKIKAVRDTVLRIGLYSGEANNYFHRTGRSPPHLKAAAAAATTLVREEKQ